MSTPANTETFDEIVEWAYSTLPQTVKDQPDFPGIQVAEEPPADLIFVFRGPILRCSRGNLRAEVKRVVWHEVAHWLGYETEEQVQALGL